MGSIKKRILILSFALIAGLPSAFADQTGHQGDNLALIITGLSGSHQFKVHMSRAAEELRAGLLASGYRADQIMLFSDSADSKIKWARNEIGTRERIEQFLNDVKLRKKPYDEAFVFIAGHANGRDEEAVFHLPGKDIVYENFMSAVDSIPANKMVVVVAAPQGHAWIKKLGKPGRVIIAGAGMRQFDFTPLLFLRIFPETFTRGIPDPEKVGQKLKSSSLTELFMYTQKEVQNWYRTTNLHPTEVALIDADGDGKGQTLIMKGVDFDSWAHGERKAKDVLEPLAAENNPKIPVRTPAAKTPQKTAGGKTAGATAAEEQILIDLPMDSTLPDAQAANSYIFTIPGGKTNGR